MFVCLPNWTCKRCIVSGIAGWGRRTALINQLLASLLERGMGHAATHGWNTRRSRGLRSVFALGKSFLTGAINENKKSITGTTEAYRVAMSRGVVRQ